ncbi:MAG: RagB/SusD family nutrient uptake outer membrane protein [Bacteroidales bacterium]|jgi:hypothetical protein|nr:RagB/SusD family nutrient uptake outer membrane protein [Bacteroidales bacterium]MCI2121666.1 RagB/SusD family nutrient uptake outer membrane protein [Bacteroidales bacterium]MCI2144631.1 RagB/SusD family nutrient uptake outer membrane protein [Bacteroidales bacterium]
MKTKVLNSIFIALLTVGLASCNLEENPYGFYSDENFYQTVDDADAALMYAYNALTFLEYSRGIFYIGECASETVDLKSGEDANNPGSQALDEWQISDNANNQTLQLYFKYCYIAINRANAVIYNVENSTAIDSTDKRRLLGEAYFLRGYNYFNLVKVFGLVPIQKQMVQTIDQTSPNMATSMDEMYDFMIGDLKYAEANLTYTQKAGRANKAAAEGMLAKLYLTAASSKESGVAYYSDMTESVDTLYADAALYAKKVLDASQSGECPFGMSDSLKDIYDVTKPNGPEQVFIMSMDRTGQKEGNYSKIGMLFMPYNNGNNFYVKSGSSTWPSHYGYEVFPTTTAFYDSFADIDRRKTELMNTKMYNADGSVEATSAYPFTLKYTDPIQVTSSTGDKSSVKPYLLRFTDIALTYVEAKGYDDGEWLAKVRERAGLAPLGTMSKSDFRDAVVQERAWEFAFEGQRLYDLRRKAMVTKKDSKAAASGVTEAQAAFYPIPQREIDLNSNL